MPRASARHILVATEKQANDLKTRIEGGEDFAALAKQHSSCPSGKSGGALGTFSQGQMVPEFDVVVFGDLPLNAVSAPVKTQFGWHLIQVDKRMM
jgi:peptidyl-prolyl cis-trans isomerase C